MSREWKPGDVAMVRVGAEYPPEVAVHGGGIFAGKWYVGGPRYGSQHGWYHDRVEVIRPLVVIDPEDREQVACLVELLVGTGWRCTTAHGLCDALREFADPTPRPDEPQGWLAAVEDPRTDQRWYRDGATDATHRWRQQRNDGIHARNTWDELPRTVRVLSEGVTQ